MYIILALNKKTMVFDVIGFRETEEVARESAEALLHFTSEYYRCAIIKSEAFIEVMAK